MGTENQKAGTAINEQGDVVLRDSASMHRYMSQLLASKALPGHFQTVESLWAAHAMFQAIGLDWRVSLRETWRNPQSGALSICGDAPLAACQRHPDYVATVEFLINAKGERRSRTNFMNFVPEAGVCIAKRKNREDVEEIFSLQQAKAAGLLTKNNWKNWPERMLIMRARSNALRNQWTDVLGGVGIREGDEGFEQPPRVVQAGSSTSLAAEMLGEEVVDAEVVTAPQPAAPPSPPPSQDEAEEELFGDLAEGDG